VTRFTDSPPSVQKPKGKATIERARVSASSDAGISEGYNDVAEFVTAARAKTDEERLLFTAYWHQVKNSVADLTSQALNTDLKHIGHPLSNVTKTFSGLIGRRPALAMQTAKTGSGAQARKKYRLTAEGIKYAELIFGKEERSNEE
jgi:hypothetical protein